MQALGACASAVAWLLGCGPPQSEAYREAEALYAPDELRAIKQQYHEHVLSGYAHGISKEHLLAWCGLAGAPPLLGDALFQAVQSAGDEADSGTGGGGGDPSLQAPPGAPGRGGDGGDVCAFVALEDVVVAKARAEKQGDAAAAEFAFQLLDPTGRGTVDRERLAAVVEALLVMSLPPDMQPADPAASAAAIAAGAMALSGTSAAETLDFGGFRKWCRLVPAVQQLLAGLLSEIGKPSAGPNAAAAAAPGLGQRQQQQQQQQQPLLAGHARSDGTPAADGAGGEGGDNTASAGVLARLLQLPALPALARDGLLQPEWVWLLAPGLPPDLRAEWRPLFSSRSNGLSFNTLMARLGDAAPTLLLVRDAGGAVFGGIAWEPWQRSGTFYGDHANKLLSLLPATCVYPASGINTNLQWCGINFDQLPNGLGFGGQVGHFGLFLSSDMDGGHSRPNATYASPSLSSEQVFKLDALEAWLLKPPDEDEEEQRRRQQRQQQGGRAKGVLAQAKEDQQLLELAGKQFHTVGLKDEPLEED